MTWALTAFHFHSFHSKPGRRTPPSITPPPTHMQAHKSVPQCACVYLPACLRVSVCQSFVCVCVCVYALPRHKWFHSPEPEGNATLWKLPLPPPPFPLLPSPAFPRFPNSLDALLNRIKQPEAAQVAPGTAKPDKVHVHRPEENCAWLHENAGCCTLRVKSASALNVFPIPV